MNTMVFIENKTTNRQPTQAYSVFLNGQMDTIEYHMEEIQPNPKTQIEWDSRERFTFSKSRNESVSL